MTLTNAESLALSTTTLPPPAQLNMSLSDCTVGLNPLDLPSRGLLLITSTTIRGEWDFRDGGRGKFDVSLNKAHLFCIDDTTNLTTSRPRIRYSGRKEVLGHFSVSPTHTFSHCRTWDMRCVRRCQREMQLFDSFLLRLVRKSMLKMSVYNLIHVQIQLKLWEIYSIVSSLRSKLMRGTSHNIRY